MPYIAYEQKNFKPETLAVIRRAEEICADYQQQGFNLTLRQLYYQFVARGLIPNRQTEYSRLGSIINDARMAGLLDWHYIEDRTRNVRSLSHWSNPGSVIKSAAYSYHRDLWSDQPVRVEVWIEKDALVGVIEGTCTNHDIAYFSCRGYTSQSEMWGAAQRLGAYINAGQRVVILHLGDHDPSGIDMTRDITERLDTFLTQDYLNAHGNDFEGESVPTVEIRRAMAERCRIDLDGYEGRSPLREAGGPFEVRRIALTMEQIEEYEPPPNPAKMTDSRFKGYVEEYGSESWELDALEPTVLAALIEAEVAELMDENLMVVAADRQESERATVRQIADRFDEIAASLNGEDY